MPFQREIPACLTQPLRFEIISTADLMAWRDGCHALASRK